MADSNLNWRLVAAAAAAIAVIVLIFAAIDRSRTASRYDEEIAALRQDRDRAQAEVVQFTELSGTAGDLEARVAETRSELDGLDAERSALSAEVDELTAQRDTLAEEVSTTEADLADARSETEALREEAEPLRQEISGYEARRAELDDEIAAATSELAEIGERLAAAREEEAALSQTLQGLADDRTRLTGELQEAEARLQEALDDEATARQAIAELNEQEVALGDRVASLETEVDNLTGRRDLVRDELAASEEKRQEMQSMVARLSELAREEAERLAEIEKSISSLMEGAASGNDQGSAPDGADASTDASEIVTRGSYESGDVTFSFEEGERFTVGGGIADGAEGSYRFDGPLLVIEADGETLRCRVESTEDGFSLSDDGDCGVLDGERFTRAAGQ